MGRMRSPGYPNAPLDEVVEFARKIHSEDRQNPVSREAAALHMGFSANSGSSDRALSALMHYGLAEKVAKGEIRVTDLALKIIHPDSLSERRAALREAAFRPDLFRELGERYPSDPPSSSTLTSYLSRLNFAPAAIGPASRAYLETCDYLQREGAYKIVSQRDESGPEAEFISSRDETQKMQPITSAPPTLVAAMPPLKAPQTDLELNEPSLSIRGGTVHIEALLDYEGLMQLEEQIQALKMLMKPKGLARHAALPRPADAAREGEN